MLRYTFVASVALICGACAAVWGIDQGVDRAVTRMYGG